MGGFSSAYDLVSSAYGWTDREMEELTLARFRQIVAAIRTRLLATERQENSRFSWLGRTLSVAITGGYMTDEKTGNPAFEQAKMIAIDEIESVALEEMMARKKSEKAAEGPAVGSYEKFMGMMKGLQR